MAESVTTQKVRAGAETGSLLLEYFLKALLIAGLSELILYRLVSRLGMHLSKVAKEYVVVEYFLRGASAVGFVLMNFSAILVFPETKPTADAPRRKYSTTTYSFATL